MEPAVPLAQQISKVDGLTMIQSNYGNPVLIQSRFGGKGNFELVYPDAHAGIRFMWRNNG